MQSSPEANARTPGTVTLPPGPIDAWAWSKRITGTCSCDPGYATAIVQVNGLQYETPRESERFSVTVRLREAVNDIIACCRPSTPLGVACVVSGATVSLPKGRPSARRSSFPRKVGSAGFSLPAAHAPPLSSRSARR